MNKVTVHSVQVFSATTKKIRYLFNRLFNICDTHPIFSNHAASEKIHLARVKIDEIRDYFSTWRNDIIPLHDYIELRGAKYPEQITAVRNFAGDTSLDTIDCISAIKEIENRELLGLCS